MESNLSRLENCIRTRFENATEHAQIGFHAVLLLYLCCLFVLPLGDMSAEHKKLQDCRFFQFSYKSTTVQYVHAPSCVTGCSASIHHPKPPVSLSTVTKVPHPPPPAHSYAHVEERSGEGEREEERWRSAGGVSGVRLARRVGRLTTLTLSLCLSFAFSIHSLSNPTVGYPSHCLTAVCQTIPLSPLWGTGWTPSR